MVDLVLQYSAKVSEFPDMWAMMPMGQDLLDYPDRAPQGLASTLPRLGAAFLDSDAAAAAAAAAADVVVGSLPMCSTSLGHEVV